MLVRGYANLAVLTEFCPHPAHKVFEARALLYAQRQVAREPDSVRARRHRAYALAAAGLPAAALADLAAGEKEAKPPAKEETKTPGWVKIIDAYCRYDVEKLASFKDDPALTPLAGLCCYLALERSGCEEMAIGKGRALLSDMPECYRLYDGLNRLGGVGLLHFSTTGGMTVAGERLYGRLAAMPGLPAAAAAIAKDRQGKRAVQNGLFGGNELSLADEFKTRGSSSPRCWQIGTPANRCGVPWDV